MDSAITNVPKLVRCFVVAARYDVKSRERCGQLQKRTTFCVGLPGFPDELGGSSTRSGQRGVLKSRNICLLQGEFEMKSSSLLVDGKITRGRNHSRA